jgi:acyl-CoA oxidase
MPGVRVGDIGTKLGANGNDNGWLMFDNVHIPRFNMLSKFTEVTEEGDFDIKGDIRAVY